MNVDILRVVPVAILATALVGGCEGNRPSGGGPVLGETADGIGYCISNVRVDANTIHFFGHRWLIGIAEGAGPRNLSLEITEAVAPEVSVQTETGLEVDPGDISEAVGYSVATSFEVAASSTIEVAEDEFRRLEAYTSYQRALWEIHDAACGARIGVGASYKPVGVYFQTVEGASFLLPDPGVHVVDCLIPGCPPPPPGVVVGAVGADGGAPVDADAGAPVDDDAGAPVEADAGTPAQGADAGAPAADGGG
jgi:hypothetical protein